MSVPKILLVEDDLLSSKVLSYKLSARGYQVHTAYNAREAAEITLMANPHLVILDLNLSAPDSSPGKQPGGLGYLEWLNENVVTNRPEVIVVSALSPIKAAIMTRKLGAIAFLQKPADDRLFAMIDILFGKQFVPKQPRAN